MEGMTLLTAIGALLTFAGVTALVVVQLKNGKILDMLASSFNVVKQHLPERHLLESIRETGCQLNASLDTHEKVVSQLPQLVSRDLSKEVKTGIDPVRSELGALSKQTEATMSRLTSSLAQSHEKFMAALLTLNAEGQLTEWVNAFREAVEPLQSSAASLQQHYDTAERLLKTTEDLVVQWTGQRQVVENAFTRFSEAIQRWTVEETTRFSEVEGRIMNRLEEVANTNALVSQSLSELQSAQTNMTGSQRELSDTVKQSVRNMHDIMETVQRSQEQHIQLNRGQEDIQNSVKTFMADMDNRIKTLDNRIKKIMSDFEQVHRTFAENVQQSIANMLSAMKTFNEAHSSAIDTFKDRHMELAQSQSQFIKKQDAYFRKLDAFLNVIPSKNNQLIIVVLFVIQIIVSVLIAIKLK